MSACVQPAAEAAPWEPITLYGPAQPLPQPKASERVSGHGASQPHPGPPGCSLPGVSAPCPALPSSQQSPRGLHSSLAYKPLTGLRVDPGMPCAASNTCSPGAALRLVCKQDRGRPPSWLLDDQVLCMCGDCPLPLASESSAVAVVGEGSADPLRPAPHRILSDKLRQRDRGHPHPPPCNRRYLANSSEHTGTFCAEEKPIPGGGSGGQKGPRARPPRFSHLQTHFWALLSHGIVALAGLTSDHASCEPRSSHGGGFVTAPVSHMRKQRSGTRSRAQHWNLKTRS